MGAAYVTLEPGDPAPHFAQTALSGAFNLSNLGGGLTVIAIFMSSAGGVGKAVLEIARQHSMIFEKTARFLAVTVDRDDAMRLKDARMDFRIEVILDFDGKVARRYGAIPAEAPPPGTPIQFRPRFIVLDRRLRVISMLELRPDGGDANRIIPQIEALPGLAEPDLVPPVLIAPRIFPADFCRDLIARFESGPHVETGIVSQTGERTSVTLNRDFKRRRDYRIQDPDVIQQLKAMLRRRLVPEIAKAFQFQASHVERHIISRYTAEERGHFRAHRDNNTLGTAYRRFAATINLNDAFEGGTLSFPEFGQQSFKAPAGGAVVFSCSLLHEVSVMTQGTRYAYLPFFFDEAAAKILEDNRASWTDGDLAPPAGDITRL